MTTGQNATRSFPFHVALEQMVDQVLTLQWRWLYWRALSHVLEVEGIFTNISLERDLLCGRIMLSSLAQYPGLKLHITPSHWPILSKDLLNSLGSIQPSCSSRSVLQATHIQVPSLPARYPFI
jgi:hypothetical protein